MVLLNEKYLNVSLDQNNGILHVKWTGFTSSQEFRQGIDQVFSLMAEHKIQKTLTDVSEHKVISTEDQDYATRRSVEFTRNYWSVKRALITPKDVFARFGLKQVNNKVAKEDQQERQVFDNEDSALEWLNS